MTAQTLMDILDRNNQHGILLVKDDGTVFEMVHLEEGRFSDGTHLRYWFFDRNGKVTDTHSRPAPKGELELLYEYADNLDTYGMDGEMGLRVAWC